MKEVIERLFPRLRDSGYRTTSSRDPVYNCIAWSVGVTDAWWWPADPAYSYWPEEIPREQTLAAFRQLYRLLGYDECVAEELEPGLDKVALFCNGLGQPTHAARQLANGRWTSKLGESEDIEHDLHDLEGDIYGVVVLLLSRAASGNPSLGGGP